MSERSPRVDGDDLVSTAAIAETAEFIAGVQMPTGQIPWFPDGEADPWDHVEAAMALDVAGRPAAAEAAYEWLRRTQNPDGSWYRGYRGARVSDPVRESNFSAYVAVGVWHHFLSTGDEAFLDRLWPTVCAAMSFVLRLQRSGGEVAWALDPHGEPAAEALLTGCSSMFHSLRCALAVAEHRGEPQPDWELAAAGLSHALLTHPERFSPRDRYSMDWYYPILGGALRGPSAFDRICEGWNRFVVPGLGARCVSDRPWVTVAETSELALSLCALGEHERAAEFLEHAEQFRHDDGSYWTGYVYQDGAVWPEERTTWTAAAVLLAAAVLAGEPPTTAVFVGDELPVVATTFRSCHPDRCPL